MGNKISETLILDVERSAMVSDDVLASVARRSLVAQGREAELWDRLPLDRQQTMMAGVAAILTAMTDLGWRFVLPTGVEVSPSPQVLVRGHG